MNKTEKKNYEIFDRKGQRYKVPYIGILKNGMISLSKGIVDKFKLCPYKYACLAYNSSSNIINIIFLNEFIKGKCYKLIERGDARRLGCNSALKYFGIVTRETMKYYESSICYDEKERMLSIKLRGKDG